MRSLDAALSRNYKDISTRELDEKMLIPQLISSWHGIANITVVGLDAIESNAVLIRRVSSVLEEMITNTIRYGEADEIQIELTQASSYLNILLKHNGKGAISKKSGLGSLLLAYNSNSSVKIESENGMTILRISIPISVGL
jgi:signal transduction histidine kinase